MNGGIRGTVESGGKGWKAFQQLSTPHDIRLNDIEARHDTSAGASLCLAGS
jgi:hypothetical protein